MLRIGIDLGGTNIKAGVVDECYNIIGCASTKTNAPRPAVEIADDMAKTALAALQEAGAAVNDVERVGIGSPGMIDVKKGVIEFAGNLGFKNEPLAKMVEEKIMIKTLVENDANAAAFGEYIAGVGSGKSLFIAVTLGTGVGGGIISGGKILPAGNNAGSELGHMVIMQDGEACTCGRRGCFEAYASATALIRQTKRVMEKNPGSLMWELSEESGKVSGKTAFDAMRGGDTAGKTVVDAYIRHIATGVTNIINIFQPEVLCIGGGICNEGEYLLEPLRNIVRGEQFGGRISGQTEICRALLGNDAGIIGAAYI